MLSLTLLITLISAFITCSLGIEQCSSNESLYVEERKVDHGSLSAFYSIAQKIADGLQPAISNETIAEIKNIVTAEKYDGNKLTHILDRQFKNEQVGTIIFLTLGFAIAVFTLIFGAVVFIWQCCSCLFCGCCDGKGHSSWEDSSISIYSRILLLLAFVCCAAFIVAGLIINNQSSSRVFTAVEKSNNFVREFTGDIRKVYKDSTKSVICAVDTAVNKTLDQVDKNVVTAPIVLLNKFNDLTGIAPLDQIEWTKINETVNDTSGTIASMRNSIQELQASSPSIQCETKLIAMKATLDKIDSQINSVQNVTQVQTFHADIEGQIYNTTNNLAQSYVSDAIVQVRLIWMGFRKIIERSDKVSEALDGLNKNADDMVNDLLKNEFYEPVKQGSSLLVVIPSVIILIVIIFTAALLLFYARDRRGDLSCMANCGFKIAMIGFYITIILAFLVVSLSSIEYLGGTITSAMCKTFFQEPDYPGLSILSLKDAELFAGHTLNVSARDVLMQCRENHTLWTAVGADKTFGVSSVLEDLHLPSSDNETSTLIKEIEKELTQFKQQIEPLENEAGSTAQILIALANGLTPYMTFNECRTYNPNATNNVENGVVSINSSIVYISDEMQQINDILTTITTRDAKLEEIQKDVRDLVDQPIQDGVEGLLNDLTTKLLPCRGVYNTYHNLGSYLCGDLGGPVHGLWASAGLCGLCFVVTAIMVLVVNCKK